MSNQSYSTRSSTTAFLAGLAGFLVSLTISPPALSQVVESQINRPVDPIPTKVERNAAISELVAQLEKGWQGSYESFLQRKVTPYNDLGENKVDLNYQGFDAIALANEKPEEPEKPPEKSPPTRLRQATTIRAIQRTLAKYSQQSKQRTAVVYIRPGQDYTTLIVVPPSGDPIVRLNREASERQVAPVTQEFLRSISNPRSAPDRHLSSARKLYEWFIQPLEATLAAQKIDTLMLCVGSGLRGLPFAALHDGQQYLVERYNLSLIPAFSLTQFQSVSLRNSKALATGAASFKAFSPLPGVPIELSSVQRLLPNSQVLINPQFTIKNVSAALQAGSYQILHIATHGEFRPGNAEDAFIQFWDSPLRLDQFSKLDLSASRVQLLVLSACQTALGDQSAELGFSGLALYSGVPSVVGSLWSISDPGTVAFMNEFYWQLLSAPTRSAALRQAQIKMISGSLKYRMPDLLRSGSRVGLQLPPEFATQIPDNLALPYYWSPFVLIGNPW